MLVGTVKNLGISLVAASEKEGAQTQPYFYGIILKYSVCNIITFILESVFECIHSKTKHLFCKSTAGGCRVVTS